MTARQYEAVRMILKDEATVRHGDCIGADSEFHDIAYGRCFIIVHPPLNDKYRAFCSAPDHTLEPQEYLVRNKAIVNQSDILIAAPAFITEEWRSGTWSTVRHARKTGTSVIILDP